MCAQCTLALCCHNKPNPTTSTVTPPVCPFCRSTIACLVVAQNNNNNNEKSKSLDDVVVDREAGDVSSSKFRKHRRSINLGEESSSFMGLSTIGSFGRITGRGSGRIAADNELMDKPILWGSIPFMGHGGEKVKDEGVKLWECIKYRWIYVRSFVEGRKIEIKEKDGKCVMQGFVVSLIKFGQNGLLLLLFGYLIWKGNP